MDERQIFHLTDRELLGKLIGAREARKVYVGSLQPLFGRTDAFGPAQAKCAIARELVKRWLGEELSSNCVLTAPAAVKDFLRIHFANQEYESFVALFLTAQNRLISAEELFRGTLTQTSVYPREIVRAALRLNAASVLFAHNHPSGEANPSAADRSLTRALIDALALVDVRVLDHLIVGGATVSSFAENGQL